jgi:hypothetical protein
MHGKVVVAGFVRATLRNNHDKWSPRLFRVIKPAFSCRQKLREAFYRHLKVNNEYVRAARRYQQLVVHCSVKVHYTYPTNPRRASLSQHDALTRDGRDTAMDERLATLMVEWRVGLPNTERITAGLLQ